MNEMRIDCDDRLATTCVRQCDAHAPLARVSSARFRDKTRRVENPDAREPNHHCIGFALYFFVRAVGCVHGRSGASMRMGMPERIICRTRYSWAIPDRTNALSKMSFWYYSVAVPDRSLPARRPGRHTVRTYRYDICVVFRFVVPVRGFMIIFIISGIVPWPPTFVTVLFDRYSNPHAQRTYARADLLQQSYCPQFCALCASSREPRQHSHTDRDALSFGDLHVAHATRLSRQQSRRS